ncbi:Tfx family DNA-binding protein [Oxyplasma meridianum]|uniref:Tfx family DNA-binding protein n=2 Tax=Oxyplasma meridianum TaxID=3073602 RepID=A0AAX4NIU5_9ARCH
MPTGQKDQNKSFLTERQREIMRMRRKNMKSSQIAKILNITRQDVTILEKRAMANIQKAFNTIQMAYEEGLSVQVEIGKGVQILDAIKEILSAGDRENIKIKSSIPEIFTILKICHGSNIKNGIIQKGTEVSILLDGTLNARQINE